VYLLLFSYICSFSKSPIVQSVHWIAHTATVLNSSIATFDDFSTHHHQQEIAIQQLEQLQKVGNEQPDSDQNASTDAPKKKIQITPTLTNFTPFQHQVAQHLFNYRCTFLTSFAAIHYPPPKVL
jgi:hypothetical protein